MIQVQQYVCLEVHAYCMQNRLWYVYMGHLQLFRLRSGAYRIIIIISYYKHAKYLYEERSNNPSDIGRISKLGFYRQRVMHILRSNAKRCVLWKEISPRSDQSLHLCWVYVPPPALDKIGSKNRPGGS